MSALQLDNWEVMRVVGMWFDDNAGEGYDTFCSSSPVPAGQCFGSYVIAKSARQPASLTFQARTTARIVIP